MRARKIGTQRPARRWYAGATVFSLIVLLTIVLNGSKPWETGRGASGQEPPVASEGKGPSAAIPLTPEERDWLEAHPSLRLGVDPAWPPYEFVDSNGRYSGIAADYVKLIRDRLGIAMEVQPGLTWEQVLTKLQNKELDVSPAITQTPERSRFLLFAQPHIKYAVGIVTRLEHVGIERLGDLAGRRVALVKGYAFTEIALANQPDIIPLYVETVMDGLNKVSNGEADAIVSDLPSLSYKITEYNFLNLKVAGIAPFQTDGLRIGVRNDWPILASILEKTVASITPEEHQRIRARWITLRATERVVIDLSPEEREWLARHPVIRNAADPAWAPIEFFDEQGRRSGFTSEYLSLFEQMLHVRFETPTDMSWGQMMDGLKDGRFDMASCVRDTPQRRSYLEFTEPYLSMPTAIFARSDVTYADLNSLKGRRVAVVQGYALQDLIGAEYPEIQLVPVPHLQKGLTLLSHGDVYAYVDALAPGSFGLNRHGFTNVHVVGETPFRYEMSMAASKEQPVLASILQKTLKAVPEGDRDRFFNKWATVPLTYRPDYSNIWSILAGAAVLLLVFFYWNRRLSHEVLERRKVEAAMRQAQEELEARVQERTAQLAARNTALADEVLERRRVESALRESESSFTQLFQSAPVPMAFATDADGYRGTTWNEAWYRTFHYPRETAEGRSGNDIGLWVNPDDRTRFVELTNRYNEVADFETQLRRYDGRVLNCSLFGRFIDKTAGRLLMAVYLDTTERKRAEDALRAKTEELDRFFSVALDLLCIADTSGYFRRLNPQWQAVLGYPVAELEGRQFSELVHPDDLEATRAAVNRLVLQESLLDFTNRYRCRDGTYRWIEWRSVPAGRVIYAAARDITDRKQAEDALRNSLLEKESLLKEVHHRVKNNLQVISSLLKLQARKVRSPEVLSFLRDTQNRVHSMALLHETLYRSGNLARVGFPHYVKNVCAHVARSYASEAANIRLLHEVEDVILELDQAIPAGLIISELVSNAFKHAFPSRSEGEILVQLTSLPDQHLVLRVSDNGVGLPEQTNPQNAESLGLLLVRNLARQLDGRMSVSSGMGTVFEITFPAHPGGSGHTKPVTRVEAI